MKLFKNHTMCPDSALLILRVFVGVLFMVHGFQKLSGLEGVIGFFGSLGFAPLWAYVVAGVEVLGGFFLILGLWSRLATILLTAVIVVAIAKVKLPKGGILAAELDLLYLGSLITIFFAGVGKYAIGGHKVTCACCTSCNGGCVGSGTCNSCGAGMTTK